MFYKKITLNGENILQEGVHFTTVNWLETTYSDESRDILGRHASLVSPTYANARIVTLEGIIDRRRAGKEAIYRLRSMFALQSDTIAETEKHELIVTDEFDDDWRIFVKVKEPLEMKEWDENWRGEFVSWRVVLQSVGRSEYERTTETRTPAVGYGEEGMYGGVRLGMSLGVAWDEHIASVTVRTHTPTPLRLEIDIVGDGVQSPLIIRNLYTGANMYIDENMNAGDKIIVDTKAMKITKNGNDITASRRIGSIFPFAKTGESRFVIEDNDGRILSKDVRVAGFFTSLLR